MKRIIQLFLIVMFGTGYLVSAACQARPVRPLVSTPPSQDPDPAQTPLIKITFDGFDPETTVLRFSEGQTVTLQLDSVDSRVTQAFLNQTSGPRVDFGEMSTGGITSDGDIMDGDGVDDIRFTLQDVEGTRVGVFPRFRRLSVKFVMPSVTTRTQMTFRFQSSNPSESRTRSIPIIIEDDAGAITLTGKVSKGLVSNTKVKLFSVDGFLDDLINARQVVEPVQIDAAGTYTFTLLPAIDFEKLLLYEIDADGADMVCDAPRGCGAVAFGETYEVKKDLNLRAYIEVPQLGTTQFVYINMLTTLTAKAANAFSPPFSAVNPEDVADGQRAVAGTFGLPNQDFTRLPFVDVTKPIITTNENAIRVAMINGGILGAAYAHSDPDDDKDYLEELDDFLDDFGDGKIACKDTPAQTTLSIEDVMIYALELAQINGNATTQSFFVSRLNDVRNGVINCNLVPADPEKADQ